MSCPKFEKYSVCKDPDSIIPYGRNWGTFTDDEGLEDSGWLVGDDIITDSQWFITSDKEEVPTLVVSASHPPEISVDGKLTQVWLESGTVKMTYNLTNRVATSSGIVEERTGVVSVVEK